MTSATVITSLIPFEPETNLWDVHKLQWITSTCRIIQYGLEEYVVEKFDETNILVDMDNVPVL